MLLYGLPEIVVWKDLVTRKPLVCARRGEWQPISCASSEMVLDGSAAVGVAVQCNHGVTHLIQGNWAHEGLRDGFFFFHLGAPGATHEKNVRRAFVAPLSI